MNRAIKAIEAVSDGMIVEFQAGVRCYFSADFLLRHVGHGSNRIFLDYDPTPGDLPGLMSTGQVPGELSVIRCMRES